MGELKNLIIYDFDGVMTDNTVHVTEDGKESVVCHRDDGWAVELIRKLGIRQLVLSSETNPVVAVRCNKLKLECISGCITKKEKVEIFCRQNGYDLQNVYYVGNGLNDLEVMKNVGYSIAPADAHPAVKAIAKYTTIKKSGEGALLEVYELLLKPKQSPTISIRFRHVGLVTDDVRTSIVFYNKLGFVLQKECEEDQGFINNISNCIDVRLTTYKMLGPAGDMIELLSYHRVKSYRHNQSPTLFDKGVAHFALTVGDISIVRRNLLDIGGVRFLSSITTSIDKKARVMFVVSPEGSFIELVEEIE